MSSYPPAPPSSSPFPSSSPDKRRKKHKKDKTEAKKKRKKERERKKPDNDKTRDDDRGAVTEGADGGALSPLSPSSPRKRQRRESAAPPAAADSNANNELPATPGDGRYLAEQAAAYLALWDENRAGWKFKKVRQTWLLHNMWHPGLVSRATFVVLLRYLEGLRGVARTTTLEQAQKILSEGLETKAVAETGATTAVEDTGASSVGDADLVGAADPAAVEKQRKATEKLRRIRFGRADAIARLLA